MAQLRNTIINDTGSVKLPEGTTAQRPTPQNGQIRYNSSTLKNEYYNADIGEWVVTDQIGVVATGGNAVYDVDDEGATYRVHVFTSTGNSTFSVDKGGEVEYLIVAGGGGGGASNGAGGGAGGLVQGTTTVTPQNYTITVGAGAGPGPRDPGAGNVSKLAYPNGIRGDNSTAFGLTAIGGGNGSGDDYWGVDGGSGGGGADDPTRAGPGDSVQNSQGSTGFGFRGGDGRIGGNGESGAGGGGAGGRGGDNDSSEVPHQRRGGAGMASSINGILNFYAGGGGGGMKTAGGTGVPGEGGFGGGGRGAERNEFGDPGVPNTGGGGGGNSTATQSNNGGGSGIVIVRYPLGKANPVTAPKMVDRGLIMDYDFSKPEVYNGEGNRVYSTTSYGIQGAITNSPRFVFGRTHRSSFYFNGSNTYIQTSGIKDIPTTQVTVEAWFYPRKTVTTSTRRGGVLTANPSHYFGIFDSNDGGATHGLHWALQTSSTRPGSNVGSLPINTWSYAVGTYDGSRIKAYVNGVELWDVPLTGTISGDGQWWVGNYIGAPTDGTHNFDGEIALARVYNRALTQAEIENNYNVTRWRFGI